MRRLRHLAIAVVAVAMLGVAVSPSTGAQTGNEGLDKIEHVVIIMQENRTFDEYFGTFPGADGFPLDAQGNIAVCIPNPFEPGTCARPYHDPKERQIGGPHSYAAHVTSVNGGKMDGFLQAFQDASKPCPKSTSPNDPSTCGRTIEDPMNVMGYKDDARHPQLLGVRA